MIPNGEAIRELVDKLPPHVFDDMVYEFPDLLEMDTWKTEFVHWKPKPEYDYEDICDYWDLDPDDPELYLQEYDEGFLVIE